MDNLNDWDGVIIYNDNLIYRNISKNDEDELKKIFDYFNKLQLSEIYVINNKKTLLEKKLNINI